ncbi:MAG: DUF2339 domain-containing protein [Akkermansiaceae bacterium]
MEQRIQHLELQQSDLEKGIKDHRYEIQQLRHDLKADNQATEPKFKPQETPPPIKAEETKSLLENVTEKTTKPNPNTNPTPISTPKTKASPEPSKKTKRDFLTIEQDFGKVWFVRLGIISLLTGLVFLSNFAYKNFIIEWGAGARLGGMYFLAALLLGLGTYFEKAKAALSNYGKVLAAGGIATLYYTSYAAHHIDRLKVIDSPLLAGILLTASAAACLTYALWKRSNITAICSIALAYYSTSINPVGAFSLVSGLLLTLTGLTLLHKLRSASIGFVSMLGAYLSFIYWQVFVNHSTTNYEYASWFILGYWILSTASILIPRSKKNHPFDKSQLLTFTSLNNAFLVILMSINFQTQTWLQPLWPVSATIGTAFILLALFLQFGEKLTPRVAIIAHRSSLSSLFIMKGIALITLALCLKLTGPSLALSLTIQAALLLIASCRAHEPQRNYFTTAFYLTLLLGFAIYISAMSLDLAGFTLTNFIMALLYLAISTIAHFGVPNSDETKPLQSGLPTIFSIIATCCCINFAPIPELNKILILLTLNLALTLYQLLSNRKNILPDFCTASHAFTALAVITIIKNAAILSTPHLFLITLMMFTATAINLCLYIHRDNKLRQYTIYLIASTILLLSTLISTESIPTILLIGTLIPLTYHAIYQKLIQHNLRFIAILGFLVYPFIWFVHLASHISYYFGSHITIHLIVAVIPVLHIILIKQKTLTDFKAIRPILTIASASMLALWQIIYIAPWQLTLALTACVYHLLDQQENKLLTAISTIFYTTSIYSAVTILSTSQATVNFIALLPLAIYFARKGILNHQSLTNSNYYLATQRGIAVLASLMLWSISSLHLIRFYDGSALSIVWAVVGLIILSLGFINKDITFRTMAFIILGCTVLHVYGIDVWKLNAILRIVSFITLGVVLLIIGYLYCRKVDQTEPE